MIEPKAHYEVRLSSIETLSVKIAERPVNFSNKKFNFQLSVNFRVNAEKSLIFAITNVDIKDEGQEEVLGHCSVLIGFEVKEFEKHITKDAEDTYDVPEDLSYNIRTISISTTRGVMHSIFNGTYLRGATLPLIGNIPIMENVPED